MEPIEKRPGCLKCALDIVGDKWTPLIVAEITSSPRTFSQLETSLVGISPRTLSARLDKLADEQIIEKIQYCEHPPRYQYKLTKKGTELRTLLVDMASWGSKYYKAS